ncbi:MAG TPA: hypothetical protein VGW75_11785 [Solirubrobacteraceae bacterium]|jgi:hypothetical protein|nr:hypothetical protein [Solirubrobacteraceae bacterium]
MELPRRFETTYRGAPEQRPIVVRPGVDPAAVDPLLERLQAVDWAELYHAYGPATDVPGQLAAVIVGDDQTRAEAWANLWGNIHHQGTIYEATVPAVPIVLDVAGWREHPDRVEALWMLREIGDAEGVSVWRYDSRGEIVADEDAQERLYPELRSELTAGSARLLERWRSEPDDVQRALLWLLSVLPDLRAQHGDLIREILPERHRRAWELVIAAEWDEDEDAVEALEEWAQSGSDR